MCGGHCVDGIRSRPLRAAGKIAAGQELDEQTAPYMELFVLGSRESDRLLEGTTWARVRWGDKEKGEEERGEGTKERRRGETNERWGEGRRNKGEERWRGDEKQRRGEVSRRGDEKKRRGEEERK